MDVDSAIGYSEGSSLALESKPWPQVVSRKSTQLPTLEAILHPLLQGSLPPSLEAILRLQGGGRLAICMFRGPASAAMMLHFFAPS